LSHPARGDPATGPMPEQTSRLTGLYLSSFW
jgi:hypothetical protein